MADTVKVAKPPAGSVIFRDRTVYEWPEDGATLEMRADHAEQLRAEFPDGFGFDGDPAPPLPPVQQLHEPKPAKTTRRRAKRSS